MLSNTIFIQSGQCGNQVGYEIISSLYNHTHSNDEELSLFFRTSPLSRDRIYARVVCLDTEPKVIQSCMNNAKTSNDWHIDPKSVAYRHGGAGNNWALGYEMLDGDFMEISLDLVRREIEMCDMPPLLLSIHSMAGGTGSGLGAKMTEALRDDFGDIMRANLAVLPYRFGEVVVQNYNAILSLSKISSCSDAVVLFENDVAQDLCRGMRGIERPSLQDINSVIAANIVPILLPKYDPDSSHTISTSFADDIIHLCSHPGFRVLDVKTVPQTSEASVSFTTDTWPTLLKTLLRMQTLGVWSDVGLSKLFSYDTTSPKRLALTSTLGTVLTLRGVQSNDAINTYRDYISESCRPASDLEKLSQLDINSQRQLFTGRGGDATSLVMPPTVFASYLHEPIKVCYSTAICNRYEHSASMLSNSQAILPVLERSVNKATELFNAGAYVHQYSAHGLDNESFVKSFRQVGQIIQNYRSLSYT